MNDIVKKFIDKETFAAIGTKENEEGNVTLFCSPVDCLDAKDKPQQRCLLMNESHLTIYAKRAFRSNLVLEKSYKIMNITKIFSEEPDKVTITFQQDNLTLISPNCPHLILILMHFIHNIFMDIEKPEVELEMFDYKCLKHSKMAALQRMRTKILSDDENAIIAKDFLQSYTQFLESGSRDFLVNKIANIAPYVTYALDGVSVEPTITNLVINNIPNVDAWEAVNSFVATNSTITDMSIYLKAEPQFKKLPFAFEANPRSKIRNFVFINNKFKIEDITTFLELFRTVPIETLAFQGSMDGREIGDFVSLCISNPQLIQKLRSLTISTIKNIDVGSLFPFCGFIPELTIVNCFLQLSEILQNLCQETDIPMKTVKVNVSGNKCDDIIPADLDLPPSITTFMATNIIYKDKNFNTLFNMLRKNQIRVDLSRAVLDRERWTYLFDSIIQYDDAQITYLIWDENPVSWKLLDILTISPNIRGISFNGCFSANDPAITDLVEILKTNDTIQTCSLQGTRKYTLQNDQLIKLIKALQYNRTILNFDIRDNQLDNHGLSELVDICLENKRLKKVWFTGTFIDNYKSLEKSFMKLTKRGKPLNVHVKLSDFSKLFNGDQSKRVQIKRLLDSIREGNPEYQKKEERVEKLEKYLPRVAHKVSTNNADSLVDIHEDLTVLQRPLPSMQNTDVLNTLRTNYDYKTTWARITSKKA